MIEILPTELVVLGGVGQIFTALVYPYIRHVVFDWYNDIRKLKPLNQQIAKTYGRYIQGLNFGFGAIAILYPSELMGGSPLALALTLLIAAYWVGKVVVQFAHYPMYEIPAGLRFKLGEIGINLLFVYFAVLFSVLAGWNLYQRAVGA